MPLFLPTLLALALVGHFAFWFAVINRLHATALPYRFLKLCDAAWYVIVLGLPAALGWSWWQAVRAAVPWPGPGQIWPLATYLGLCGPATLVVTARWGWRTFVERTTPLLIANHTQRVNIRERLGRQPAATLLTRLLATIPGNQIFDLHIHDKQLRLPRLPSALSGITIAHLSDLHLTGQLAPEFFQEVVRLTNQLDADLIAITGDIVDKARCLDWIPDTLGPLRARQGVYFVLGNHDTRVPDPRRLRRALAAAGMIDLGGHCRRIEVRGLPVILAGNELPWFGPAADLGDCPGDVPADPRPLRIVLSHSPDQIDWARAHDVDLLLCGHTHGGQIRLPLIGPLVSPSRFGVDFAGGTFHRPPTLMHVSRGVSGTRQFRWNCPPELTRLTLVSD